MGNFRRQLMKQQSKRENSEDYTPNTECKGSEKVCNSCMYDDNVAKSDDDLIVENVSLDTNCIPESMPEGRQVVNILFMLNEIHRTFDNHAQGIQCLFKDWKLVKMYKRGLLTQLSFKCQMCNYEDSVWSEPIKAEANINKAAVAGSITTGIGYAQLEELCASMSISCMSEKSYIKYRENVTEDFEKTATENMKIAGECEKQLALERNEVINGIPYITVVADGSWMKRSYGTAYDSISGVGAIIGFHTGKVLFVGIRNKFCTICDIAERKGTEPKAHKCYKNFDRNATSTSMESDAIVEGFKTSIEMHGLIYRTVVADGDSSVYQSIVHQRPYREQMVTVKKVECTNHLLRNLCKKLKAVAETTQPKIYQKRGFAQLRNVVKYNILRMRKEVIDAAAKRRKHSVPHHINAVELQKDILSMPSHVFGEHKYCKERGRTCIETDKTKKNYVQLLQAHGLYQKIENAVKYLSAYSDSLLLNLTNNPAETFNSIICKEIGGKRINFGQRGSYNARIAGAVVQYNTQQVLTELHQNRYGNVSSVIENLEKRRQMKIARTRESREINGKPKKFKRESTTDCHYGPQSQKPDLPCDAFQQLYEHHLNKLSENGNNWEKIERATIDQSESELWLSLRREMLTASNFGMVCRMRATTSCATNVKNILYPPIIDIAPVKYGHDGEAIARKQLAVTLNKTIERCGLFIDRENPYLGASPDGLIDEDGLIEIKCPFAAENLTVEEAIERLSQVRAIFEKKNFDKMNQNH